ncbi:MAG: hypothetical protein NUV67_03735 [archaeon]|nr:hypothetical protein [archaeon]
MKEDHHYRMNLRRHNEKVQIAASRKREGEEFEVDAIIYKKTGARAVKQPKRQE